MALKPSGKSLLVIGAAVVVSVLMLSFAYGYVSANGWYVEEMDSDRSLSFGSISSMTTDEAGRVHIVYRSLVSDPELGGKRWAIIHSVGSGSDWTTDMVSVCGEKLRDLDIRIAEDGSTHVLWAEFRDFHYSDDLYKPDRVVAVHAVDVGGEWESASVEIDRGYSVKVALDGYGVAHSLCVVRELHEEWLPDAIKVSEWVYYLQEWTCDDGTWSLTRNHSNPDDGQWTVVCALAAGEKGEVRTILGLTRNTSASLVRARIVDAGLEWNFSYGLVSRIPSFAHARIDTEGRLHAALIDSDYPRMVVHMVDDDIAEAPEMHLLGYHGEGGLGVQAPASIFLDSKDIPHVAYISYYTTLDIHELKLAHMVEGEWEVEEVRSRNLARPKAGISVAVDGSCDTHLVFFGEYSDGSVPFVYATSDNVEVLKLALMESAIFTGVGVLVLGPPALLIYHIHRRRAEARQRSESAGLHEFRGRFRRKRT